MKSNKVKHKKNRLEKFEEIDDNLTKAEAFNHSDEEYFVNFENANSYNLT